MHLFIMGILLGLGAAVPIGPVNLEIIRRNLTISTAAGIAFGLGACLADLTYLILLSVGALLILQNIILLRVIGIIGAAILFWFGISAIRIGKKNNTDINISKEKKLTPLWKQTLASFSMTMLNPMTILFWSSVSTQIALFEKNHSHAGLFTGSGVIIGTVSWTLFLNIALHFTRHKISPRIAQLTNIIGGIIVLSFAIFSLYHTIFR